MAQSRLSSVTIAVVAAISVQAAIANFAVASSHREAPEITADPLADNTDVYAFISPNDADKIVMVANYVPLLLPDSGPNFYRFGESVQYEIGIDNDGDARSDITYQWDFRNDLRDGSTFLYNTGPVDSIGDPDLNVRQFYSLRRIDHARRRTDLIAEDVPVAPWNVGERSFPNYDAVADQAIHETADGTKVFAGPRDEPFFVDLRVFDLLGVGGTPSTDGLNVMSLVLEVPIEDLVADGVRPSADEAGPESVLGVYARSLRRRYRILGRRLRASRNHGRWVQVSRLALPLINETFIPLRDKDAYNRLDPDTDVERFGQYILNPELPGLLAGVLGLPCPPTPAGGRTDIVAVLSPNGTTPADLLRINIAEGQTFADSGFPNGRRLEDDVTDTLLTLVCNGGVPVGDGVDMNDVPFSNFFPYLAGPHPVKEQVPPQDQDGDGVTAADGDCNDDDASVKPGAPELCDGKDNDCDDAIDEGCTTTVGRAVVLDDPLEHHAFGDVVCLDEVTNGGCVFFEEGDCEDASGTSQPHLHGLVQFLGLDGPILLIPGEPGFYQEFNPVCGFGDVIEGVPGCGPDGVRPCGPPVS